CCQARPIVLVLSGTPGPVRLGQADQVSGSPPSIRSLWPVKKVLVRENSAPRTRSPRPGRTASRPVSPAPTMPNCYKELYRLPEQLTMADVTCQALNGGYPYAAPLGSQRIRAFSSSELVS